MTKSVPKILNSDIGSLSIHSQVSQGGVKKKKYRVGTYKLVKGPKRKPENKSNRTNRMKC